MSGLTSSEQEIMDLWDSGCSMDHIVEKTRYLHSYVSKVVSSYAACPRDDAWQVEASIASDALCEAVARCIQSGGAG